MTTDNMATDDKHFSLEMSRLYPAPRERVFRAWTRREELRRWFTAAEGEVISQFDPRVGGGFQFGTGDADGRVSDMAGSYRAKYLEIRFPEKLVFTWTSSVTGDKGTLVTVQFQDRDGATEVVLTHARFEKESMVSEHRLGWTRLLDQLATVL